MRAHGAACAAVAPSFPETVHGFLGDTNISPAITEPSIRWPIPGKTLSGCHAAKRPAVNGRARVRQEQRCKNPTIPAPNTAPRPKVTLSKWLARAPAITEKITFTSDMPRGRLRRFGSQAIQDGIRRPRKPGQRQGHSSGRTKGYALDESGHVQIRAYCCQNKEP